MSRGGAEYVPGERPKHAQICAKYAQNMRNPKNGVGSGTPYLNIPALLLQNIIMFLIRKKC
jgi:hypothetical protein